MGRLWRPDQPYLEVRIEEVGCICLVSLAPATKKLTALVPIASRAEASEVEVECVGKRHGGRPLVGQGDEARRVKCLASAL